MRNLRKRLFLVLMVFCILFQQVMQPLAETTPEEGISFEDSKDKNGIEDTKEGSEENTVQEEEQEADAPEQDTSGSISTEPSSEEEETAQMKDDEAPEIKTTEQKKEKPAQEDTPEAAEARPAPNVEEGQEEQAAELIRNEKGLQEEAPAQVKAADAGTDGNCNMPASTYETFILQGKNGKGQKIADSGKVKVLANAQEIQQDIMANHREYSSFTPHWGAGSSAQLSTQAGSRGVNYYLNDPAKAGYVGGIGQANMSSNIIGGRVYELSESMKNTLSCTYINVGRYYDRASGCSYGIDMKAVLVNYTPKNKNTNNVKNAIAAGVLGQDGGALLAFTGKKSIGLLVAFCDNIKLRYEFYIHGTQTRIDLKGFARFEDVDAQQGIEFSSQADYFYAISAANQYLGCSKGVYGENSKAYIYALSRMEYNGGQEHTFYSLFSGSQLTLRYTFAKCSRDDTGGEKNGKDLEKYKVPFDTEGQKLYTSSNSNGYLHFDARQPYLPEPEIGKTVFNGNDIGAEIANPTGGVNNELSDIGSAFTYKIRTVCPYGDASEHHYNAWIVRDIVNPFLKVEAADVFDGTGARSSGFQIQTQEQADGSTIVTAAALNPAEQSFYEKNWYDLYITVRIKKEEELKRHGLDFAGQYVAAGPHAGKYILANRAVLSTGNDYHSNEVETVVPQHISVKKSNEEGKPVAGVTFGIYASADAGAGREKPLMTAETGQDGLAHFKAVSFFSLTGRAGPYYIREVSRGKFENVYRLDTTWNYAFSCDMGNTVIFGGKDGRAAAELVDTFKRIKKFSVKVRKKNKDTARSLVGAVFGMYQWSDTAGSYVKVCDLKEARGENGEVFYHNTEEHMASEDNLGKFMIKEEKAPYGCSNGGQEWTFEITDAFDANEKEIEFWYAAPNGRKKSQKEELIYQNDLQKGLIIIEKRDEDEEAVEGALFSVEAAEDIYAPWQCDDTGAPLEEEEPLVASGTVCEELTTDSEGKAVSGPLYIGKYFVKETGGAPDHVKSEEIHEVTFAYPEEDDREYVTEKLSVGNRKMKPALAVAKLAERTKNKEGEEVGFDTEKGRYTEEKVAGIYNAGETIRYRITVTNTGNVELHHIKVYDQTTEENERSQKLCDYILENRAGFALPSDRKLKTEKGDSIAVSLIGENRNMAMLEHLAPGDSVSIYFEAVVKSSAANKYHLINKVSVTASYDNNAERPGYHRIPVDTSKLTDEEGNPLTEDRDCIHIPGIPDETVVKKADRTTGCQIIKGELTGSKIPGIYYEGEEVRFSVYVKNSGTANLYNIHVSDVMSEELKQVVDLKSASFRLETAPQDGKEEETENGEKTDSIWKKEDKGQYGFIVSENGQRLTARMISPTEVVLCEEADILSGEGMLAPGDFVILYFYATIKKDAANFYDLQNRVWTHASYFNGIQEEKTEDREDEDKIELPGIPEARIAKLANHTAGASLREGRYEGDKIPGNYKNGEDIVYTITVTNSGTADLYDLKVKDIMEERLKAALRKDSISFREGTFTTKQGNAVTASLKSKMILILNYLKAGDSVELFLDAKVNDKAGELSDLDNKVYVTGHYRRGDEQYKEEAGRNAEQAGHTYQVEYHANNGTSDKTTDSETPAYQNDKIIINGNPFTKEGEVFLGWNTKEDGTGEDYAPGAAFILPAQDVHLYARWGKKGSILKKQYEYLLEYRSNNPLEQSRPDSETRCLAKTAVVLDENTFRYEGYQFIGWSTSPDGEEETLQPGSTWRMPAKDVILYARWKKEKQVSLIYDANIPEEKKTERDFRTPCKTGTRIPLKMCEWERKDYRFAGWGKTAEAQQAEFLPGQSYVISEDTVLYAIWEKEPDGKDIIRYKLTYHANNETDQTAVDGETPCEAGGAMDMDESIFAYPGHIFAGWNTKADGTGKMWSPGEKYTMPGRNVHLYAQWKKEDSCSLFYISNYPAGTGEEEERIMDCETPCARDETVTVDGSRFRCKGYTFVGWSRAADGSSEIILPETKWKMEGETELYAVWSNDYTEYTLLYFSNNEPAMWEAAPQSPAPSGTPHTLISNPFSNSEAAFVGWSTKKDAKPDDRELLKPGDVMEQPSENMVLYAVWQKEESRKIIYDGNGGQTPDGQEQIPDEESACIAGTRIRINPSPFIKEGYRFAGWSEDKEQQKEMQYPGCAYAVPQEDVVLYAVWEQIPVTAFEEAGFDPGEEIQSRYTPIPVTELMKDKDAVNIPGKPELNIAKKADKTKGITLKKGRYKGKRIPGTYYAGDRVIYKITVTNTGTASANHVAVKETPSKGWNQNMEAEGFTPSEGEILQSEKGNDIQVMKKTKNQLILNRLAPQDSITVTFEAIVKNERVKEASLENTVIVSGKTNEGGEITRTTYMKDKDMIHIKPDKKGSLGSQSTKTGDNNPIGAWLCICMSALILGGYIQKKQKIR